MKQLFLHHNTDGVSTTVGYYLAADVDARIADLERLLDVERRALAAAQEQAGKASRWEAEANRLGKAMEAARVTMRDLWRIDPTDIPTSDLAQRCKAFMGGG